VSVTGIETGGQMGQQNKQVELEVGRGRKERKGGQVG
jgi:hypothetical protein